MVLSVVFSLSLGAAAAADAPVSVGKDIAKIIGVNYMDDDLWVEIASKGTGSMNLAGWTLTNMENQTYSFPAGFAMEAGSIVRVHTGKGSDTAFDLYNSTLLWSTEGDIATLKDAAGKVVSEYEYPIKVSAFGSATNTEPLTPANTSSISGTSQPFLPDYQSDHGAEGGSSKSGSPVNLTGHSFICHGGPLNWAWTGGL